VSATASAAAAAETARAPQEPVAQAPLPAKPAPRRPERKPAPAAPAAPEPELRFSRPAPQVHPAVAAGYAAYVAGDLPGAYAEYEQALRHEPGNRDALLGLAAIEVRSGRLASAEALYQRLLQADPRDAHAHAALIALRGARIDPVIAESRLKSLLANGPEAPILHFTLGNQLAYQERWAEAQQEYFRAFAADPENPDFAYNLAVSLDQLRQARPALEYYQRALALAERRSASFDAAAARTRIAQLAR
jgi:tetratricopeptide (TPR) repeat protein